MSAFAITGIGMTTSLGLDAVTSCAAARAGISRAESLTNFHVLDPETASPVPITAHQAPFITKGFTGLGRLLRLAEAGLRDLLVSAKVPNDGQTGLFINLSSLYYLKAYEAYKQSLTPKEPSLPAAQLRQEQYGTHFLRRLKRLLGLQALPQVEGLLFQDKHGFLTTLRLAAIALRDGKAQRCIIGGVDSLLEPFLLEAFTHFDVLKSADTPNGFMAGEGAGFLLLERYEEAVLRRAPYCITIPGLGEAREPFDRLATDQRALGQALSQAMQTASAPLAGQPAQVLVSDLNGEAYRATDWGYALHRMKIQSADFGQQTLLYPVSAFGETNAAHPFLAAALTTQGMKRGYLPQTALVCLASETGERAAVLLNQG